jgi:hypothetical protein
MAKKIGKLALLWRGDGEARETEAPETSRFSRVFDALKSRGIDAEPAVYSEDCADEIQAQLRAVDGVLVWVNPLANGQTRIKLDAMLRDVASAGVWVSAHPDVILKMGVKEVLHRTKHLGWGTDTHLYRSGAAFREAFPQRLRSNGPRVLKQNRGNGGQGVWKVEILPAPQGQVHVLQALRGSAPEDLSLNDFMARCDEYFSSDGCIIDQPFQSRLPDGMIRCYMSGDRVVGFGHQLIKALVAPSPEGPDAPSAQPGPRIMHPRSTSQFQRLQTQMETEWIPSMMTLLEIDQKELPLIWDADFLYGPRTAAGEDTYVLCEINVSSVFPIPDDAPEEIARSAEARLMGVA